MKNSKNASATLERQLNRHSQSLPGLISPTMREVKQKSRLGPGFYNYSLSTLSGPSFQFSITSRFKNDDPYYFYYIPQRKTSVTKLPEIVIDNFKPSLKLSNIKIEAAKLTSKIISIKQNKKQIELAKKIRITQRLKKKSENFETRQRAKDFKAFASKMLLLMVSISITLSIKQKMKLCIYKKVRVNKLIHRCKYLFMAVGKFRTTLRKFRVLMAYKIIRKTVCNMKKWLNCRKSTYRNYLFNSFDTYFSKPLLAVLYYKFTEVIRSIQRSWRKNLQIKNVALKAKVLIFKHIESEINFQSKNKKKYKIPLYIIIRKLRKCRKTQLKEYSNLMFKYKKHCENQLKVHTKYIQKIMFLNSLEAILPEFQLPNKPHAWYTISYRKYKDMVLDALVSRHNWEKEN